MNNRCQCKVVPIKQIVKAKYSRQRLPNYKGNPFIEALPKIYSADEVGKRLTYFPPYDSSQREWDIEERIHLIEGINQFNQVLPQHIELARAVSRVLRGGYIHRNPLSTAFVRQFSIGFEKILQEGLSEKGTNISGNVPTANGFALVGDSGTGKTTAMNNILSLYPPVIGHTIYKGKPLPLKQLVWLKLDCPANGSLKVLCQNFFNKVDFLLGSIYSKQYVKQRCTKETLLAPMAQIASLHGLGVLVIDEIQRLSLQKNGGEKEMLNYFTELINTIGLPVIIIGTPEALPLISASFAEARRASGQEDPIFRNLDNGPEWELFLSSLWELQWTRKICPLTPELQNIMYYESQGNLDIAVKIYRLVQWKAISSGTEIITPDLIRGVCRKSLVLVQPMLNVLRHGYLLDGIKQFSDLESDWISMSSSNKPSKTEKQRGNIANKSLTTMDEIEPKSKALVAFPNQAENTIVTNALDGPADCNKINKGAEEQSSIGKSGVKTAPKAKKNKNQVIEDYVFHANGVIYEQEEQQSISKLLNEHDVRNSKLEELMI